MDVPGGKRGRPAPAAEWTPTITALGGGGFACSLLSNEGPPQGTDVVVRITRWRGIADHIRNHEALAAVLTWGVPKIVAGSIVQYPSIGHVDFPRRYVDAMNRNDTCAAKVLEWSDLIADDVERTPITVYRMEYANQGSFEHYQWSSAQHRRNDPKRFAFLAIGLIYAAGWRLGFQHSDLTPDNLLVHNDPLSGEIFPWLADFDLATLGAQPRKTGSLYVAPPEAFLARPAEAEAEAEVLCAYDIWSLGMCLLGKAITPKGAPRLYMPIPEHLVTFQGLHIQSGVDVNVYRRLFTYYAICAFHSVFAARPIERYQLYTSERALLTRVRDRDLEHFRTSLYTVVKARYETPMNAIPAELRNLLFRMLDLTPSARVFNGDMASYFYDPYFTMVADRAHLMATRIAPILGIEAMPNVMHRRRAPVADWVRSLVAAGITPLCGRHAGCGRRARYVDVETGEFVC